MQIGKEIVVLWEEPGHNVVLTHAVGQTGWARHPARLLGRAM